MAGQQFARWLMDRADSRGRLEPVIGDVLEEIAYGRRSHAWVWQELIGCCGIACATYVRDHMRVTPSLVSAALGAILLAGASMTSIDDVVETWLALYLVAGTMSLFGHIMSRTSGARSRVTSADPR